MKAFTVISKKKNTFRLDWEFGTKLKPKQNTKLATGCIIIVLSLGNIPQTQNYYYRGRVLTQI